MATTSETYPFSTAASQGNGPLDAPNTSLLPDAQNAPAASVDLMKRVVKGAHETIDRLADNAAPHVQRLGEGMASAGDALQAKAGQIRDTRDEWAESLRCTVRDNPLAAIVTALAIGALIARVTR